MARSLDTPDHSQFSSSRTCRGTLVRRRTTLGCGTVHVSFLLASFVSSMGLTRKRACCLRNKGACYVFSGLAAYGNFILHAHPRSMTTNGHTGMLLNNVRVANAGIGSVGLVFKHRPRTKRKKRVCVGVLRFCSVSFSYPVTLACNSGITNLNSTANGCFVGVFSGNVTMRLRDFIIGGYAFGHLMHKFVHRRKPGCGV